MQDYIETGYFFRKFQVDDLLFAEFNCPMEEEKTSIWWHNNFFTFIVTGETFLLLNLNLNPCTTPRRGNGCWRNGWNTACICWKRPTTASMMFAISVVLKIPRILTGCLNRNMDFLRVNIR